MRPRRPADIRGTNYYLSTSYAVEKTALATLPKNSAQSIEVGRDGFFDSRHNSAELLAIARAGFNNVRAWGSFWAWVADPPGYTKTIQTFLANCNRHGLSVTWVLWNTVHTASDISVDLLPQSDLLMQNIVSGSGNPNVTLTAWGAAAELAIGGFRAGQVPAGEPWLASGLADPGPHIMHTYTSLARLRNGSRSFVDLMTQYLAETARVMDEQGSPLFSYDMFNEPDFDSYFPVRHEMYADVIAHTHQVLSATHRAIRPHYTVGFAGLDRNLGFLEDLVLRRRVGLTYVSSHAYRTVYRMQDFTDTIRRHAQRATVMSMDYVCSEFWYRFLAYPLPAAVAGYLQVLMAQTPKVGGQMWCFLETNLFDKEMGDPRYYVAPYSPSPVPRPAPTLPPPLPWAVPPRIRFPGPEAVDGIMRPMRGQWLPLSVSPAWPSQTTIQPSGSQIDLNAILLWGRS